MLHPIPPASLTAKSVLPFAVLGLCAAVPFVPQFLLPAAAQGLPQVTPPLVGTPPSKALVPAPEQTGHLTIPIKPMVVDLGQGRFSVGTVILDKTTREIQIPASVNMREGPVEYVLVSDNGKIHESVFITRADPNEVHIAALLLGINAETNLGPANSAAVITRKGAVVIRVEWDRNGPIEKRFLNETVNISNPTTKAVSSALSSGAWLYNGSRVEPDGFFAATRHGSIISIIRDADALVNYPGISRDNDEIHTPNAAVLPEKDHPVRIILQVK
jgi:hypothetical protein